MTTTISSKFRTHLKPAPRPQYRYGRKVGLHPSRLSRIMNGEPVKPGDVAIVRLGELLGLAADECFAISPVADGRAADPVGSDFVTEIVAATLSRICEVDQ